METTLFLLKALAVIWGLWYVIHIYRQARAAHPVFQYEEHSLPNENAWRWRKPDAELALALQDDAQHDSFAGQLSAL